MRNRTRIRVDLWRVTGRAGRWYRPVALGLSVLILGFGVALFKVVLDGPFGSYWALDLAHYLDGARRFLDTGNPYLPSEVAAPFAYQPETFLHPPISLYLFLPFLVLPLPLWWAIPLGVTGWCIWSWRPAAWTWPFLAAAVAFPRFQGALILGNSDLWVLAGVAAGLRWGWPALVILAKPTLPFLMLAGAWRREWWIGLGALAAASLPAPWLWVDWVRVMANSPGDLGYSLYGLPYLVVPVVAWWARERA